jgi:hypothetical protein
MLTGIGVVFWQSAALAATCQVTTDSSWKNGIGFPDDGFRVQGDSDANPDWIKFAILLCDPGTVYFQDSNLFPLHYTFASTHLDPFIGLSPQQFDAITLTSPGQLAILGAVLMPHSGVSPAPPAIPEYGIQLIQQDPIDPQTAIAHLQTVVATVSASPQVQPYYFPTIEQAQSATQNAAAFKAAGIPLGTPAQWATGNACYSEGWALGRLVFVPADGIDAAYADGTLTPEDILLTEGVPAEIPFVAGIVSLSPATPNSHVAILAKTFNVPFVHMALPTDAQRAIDLSGNRVVLRALTGTEFNATCEVRLIDTEGQITTAQVDEILSLKALPPLDIEATQPFGAFSSSVHALVSEDVRFFGGKAANFGFIRRAIPENSPTAIAMPFDLWNAFKNQTLVTGQTLGQTIDGLLGGYSYPPPNILDLYADLGAIQDMINDESITVFESPLEAAVVAALQDPATGFDTTAKIRFRSSTNVEDSGQFTGAGLYDSKSGCLLDDLDGDTIGPSLCDAGQPEERGVFRAIRRVFASFYNDNAFLERLRWGVPESNVGMAVLLHHSFPDEFELANGVATLRRTPDNVPRFTFVTQAGANSVTNPEGSAIPEQADGFGLLGGGQYFFSVVRGSNLVALGDTVMIWDSDYSALAQWLSLVALEYEAHTGEDDYLLDFEYKKMAPGGAALPGGGLVIKQVREVPIPDDIPSITPFLLNEPTTYCTDQSASLELNLLHNEVFSNHRMKSRLTLETGSFWMTPQNLAVSFLTMSEMEFAADCRTLTLDGIPSEWPLASHAYGADPFNGPTSRDSWVIDGLSPGRTYALELQNMPNLLVSAAQSPIWTIRDFGAFDPNDRTRGCLNLVAEYDEPLPEWSCHGACALATTVQDTALMCPCVESEIGEISQERIFQFPGDVTIETSYFWPPEASGFGFYAALVRFEETTITGLTSSPFVLSSYYSQTYDPERHGFAEDFMFEPALDPGVSSESLAELHAAGVARIQVHHPIFFGGSDELMLYGPDGSCLVDELDREVFEDCFAGPAALPQPTLPRTEHICRMLFDYDDDGDVDCADWLRFASEWSAPDPPTQLANCDCPLYGDVNVSGAVDLDDVLCALDAFAGNAVNCPILSSDIAPCAGDQLVDLLDIVAVLDAFAGIDPCCDGGPP